MSGEIERLRVAMSGVGETANESRLRSVIQEELQASERRMRAEFLRILHPTGQSDARSFVGCQITTAEGHVYRGAAYLVELTEGPLEAER